jgi:hypothetical protein
VESIADDEELVSRKRTEWGWVIRRVELPRDPFPVQRGERFQSTPLSNARGRLSGVATM